LQRDSEDLAALLVLAQAAFQTGDFATARHYAARAHRVAEPEQTRYSAARLAALAAAQDGRFNAGLIWLRRALVVAPTPEDENQTEFDANRLRRLARWETGVTLSFSPSNNVNGGATTAINEVDGLPGIGRLSADAQALAGWEGELGVALGYKLAETRVAQTTASLRVNMSGVVFSPEAIAALAADESDLVAADLSTAMVEFRVTQERALPNGAISFSAAVGTVWVAGARDYDFVSLRFARDLRFNDRDTWQIAGAVERHLEVSNGEIEDDRYSLQSSWSRLRANGDQISAAFSYDTIRSENVNEAQDSITLQGRYGWSEPLGPAYVSLSLGAQVSKYDQFYAITLSSVPVPGGRQDLRAFADLTLYFPDWSYAGFAPEVTLSASTTDSNVSRFTRENLSISFGYRSTF